MACTSGCRTKDHASYAACLKDKAVRLPAQGFEAHQNQKKADRNLDLYAAVRKQGVQPRSTNPAHVQQAIQMSEQTGEAYKA